MSIRLKRIYDPPRPDDGLRILVDRLWPRGVSKESAAIDRWLREIAPSDALRKWYGHDPQRWAEFRRRYREELRAQRALVSELRKLARRRITLLFAAHDEKHNNAVVLRELLGTALRAAPRKARKTNARRQTKTR